MESRSPFSFDSWFSGLSLLMFFAVFMLPCPSVVLASGVTLDLSESSRLIQDSTGSRSDFENRPLPPSSEPRVRIRLRSASLDSILTFGEQGQQLLCLDESESRVFLRPGPLQVEYSKDGWLLTDGEMRSTSLAGAGVLSLRTLLDSSSVIFFENRSLPGFVDLVPFDGSDDLRKKGRLDVIVSVSLESYLPGVLDVELYGHWPLETFQAQAVAARSYALAEAAFWAKRRHFDLVAGPESQCWSGDGGSSKARNAVRRTAGTVLLHEGRVIPAYYSAACGGLPASADDAISSRESHRISPLVPSKPFSSECCEGSQAFEWQAEFDRDELNRALQSWQKVRDDALDPEGTTSDRFNRMTVLERSPTGRPLVYGLSSLHGTTLEIGAETFRRLLSKLVQIGKTDPSSLRSSVFTGRFRGNRFLIDGLGWGHGCGLCQYGANAMGEAGFTWEQILLRYYPGSELQALWDSERSMDSEPSADSE
jgi:stage II sporulation protein D